MLDKGQLAYKAIKEKIISGELAPLADISEKELQEELGISRTPVHEAIARLREEGFVFTFPRKGTFVADFAMETVRAVHEMRLLNEPYLTRKVMNTVPHVWLEDILYRLEHCPEGLEPTEKNTYFQALDTELHTTVISYSDNVFLRNGLQNAYDHNLRIRIKRYKMPTREDHFNVSREEHIAIVKAMLAGDGPLVEQLCREHILHAQSMLFEVMYRKTL